MPNRLGARRAHAQATAALRIAPTTIHAASTRPRRAQSRVWEDAAITASSLPAAEEEAFGLGRRWKHVFRLWLRGSAGVSPAIGEPPENGTRRECVGCRLKDAPAAGLFGTPPAPEGSQGTAASHLGGVTVRTSDMLLPMGDKQVEQTGKRKVLTPQQRDQMITGLKCPELALTHLLGQMDYETAMLQIVWSRISSLQTLAAALVAITLWVVSRPLPTSTTSWTVTAVFGLLALVTFARGVYYCVKATLPTDTQDPFRFDDLNDIINCQRTTDRDGFDQEQFERIQYLDCWIDQTDQLHETNSEKLRSVAHATRLLLWAALWVLLLATTTILIGI